MCHRDSRKKGRQDETKRRAMTGFTLDLNLSALHFHEHACNRQAKSGSIDRFRCGVVHSLKARKEAGPRTPVEKGVLGPVDACIATQLLETKYKHPTVLIGRVLLRQSRDLYEKRLLEGCVDRPVDGW